METFQNLKSTSNSKPRLRHVANHRSDCECAKCQQIRARADRGLPTKEEERQLKRKAREERQKQRRQQQPDAGSRKLRRLEQRAAIAASMATQVAMGKPADPNLALRIAGVGATDQASKNEAIGNANSSVQAALARVGIVQTVSSRAFRLSCRSSSFRRQTAIRTRSNLLTFRALAVRAVIGDVPQSRFGVRG